MAGHGLAKATMQRLTWVKQGEKKLQTTFSAGRKSIWKSLM